MRVATQLGKGLGQMLGVVFPSYRIPAHRLRDHFVWNERFYLDRALVFAVTDAEYEVPAYATCVIFPETGLPLIRGQRRFATTRCRNAGIQAAIDAGCNPIIVTDVDIAFEDDAWRAMGEVDKAQTAVAEVPFCRMSLTNHWANRAKSWIPAEAATGTVAMTAVNWGRVRYCEEQWAYGCDDGLMMKRIGEAGIQQHRAGYIYHIAHVDGANQKEFCGRSDHWNRADGFNPDNFLHNQRF